MTDWVDRLHARLDSWPFEAEVAADGVAWYSLDRRYRYALLRRWSEAPPDVWVMANPSTATAQSDDPTIARVVDYSDRWGAGGVVVVNLFAYRSTDPSVLDVVDDPVGPYCDRVIDAVIPIGGRTLLAWGTPGRRMNRPNVVTARLNGALYCLTQLQGGTSGHPLFKPAALEPSPYHVLSFQG
jgi:hypothetical protein